MVFRRLQVTIAVWTVIFSSFTMPSTGPGAVLDTNDTKILNDTVISSTSSAAMLAWDSHSRLVNPYFINTTTATVVTSKGQPAYLHCQVANSGDRKISWLRSRDLKILTIGSLTYTNDNRFSALHSESSPNTWILKISRPKVEDSGQYQCQVAYHDDMERKLTKPVILSVLDTRAVLSVKPEMFVKPGSSLELECQVVDHPVTPLYLYWYQGTKVVNYGHSPDPSMVISTSPDNTASRLTIKSARTSHSGNYSCAPQAAAQDSVMVHVTLGENPAAMQHSLSPASPSSPLFLVVMLTLGTSSPLTLLFLPLVRAHQDILSYRGQVTKCHHWT